jgi:hypothetical protein
MIAQPRRSRSAVEEHEIQRMSALRELQAGDVVVLYTDGVAEAMSRSRQQLGSERRQTMVGESGKAFAAEICAMIVLMNDVTPPAIVRVDDLDL